MPALDKKIILVASRKQSALITAEIVKSFGGSHPLFYILLRSLVIGLTAPWSQINPVGSYQGNQKIGDRNQVGTRDSKELFCQGCCASCSQPLCCPSWPPSWGVGSWPCSCCPWSPWWASAPAFWQRFRHRKDSSLSCYLCRFQASYSKEEMTMYAKAGSYAEEVLANIKTVVAFGETTFLFIGLKHPICFRGRRKRVQCLQKTAQAS